MTRHASARSLALAALLTLAAAPAWGQAKTGTTIGSFLLIEPSARITGMGNAGAAASVSRAARASERADAWRVMVT